YMRSMRSAPSCSLFPYTTLFRSLGLDPGLGTTGWGLIRAEGNRLAHIANGQIKTDPSAPLPQRLSVLADQLDSLLAEHRPDGARSEEHTPELPSRGQHVCRLRLE